MRKQIMKTLALVLVFALILSAAAPPKAVAVIPEGLLIGSAVALTFGTFVAIAMIAADSAGMKGAIQAAAEKGLQDTAEFTEQLLRGFMRTTSVDIPMLLLMMVEGARLTRDGSLALGADVSAWLTDFFDWAWSEDGGNLQASAPYVGDSYYSYDLSGYSDANILKYHNIDSVATLTATTSAGNLYSFYSGNPDSVVIAYQFVGSSSVFVVVGSKTAGTAYQSKNGSVTDSHNLVGVSYNNQLFYTTQMASFTAGTSSFNVPVCMAESGAASYIPIYVALFGNGGTLVGEQEQADTNVLQLPAEGAIDTNILNIPDQLVLPPVQGTATADSYLGAVRDAIYEGTGTLDYTDANDIAGTATLEMTGTATVDQVASGAGQLEGSTEVAEGVGSPTLDNYSIDLRDFFPFCIPFDIYDMLNLMSGSRAAPQVHWEFYVPGLNGMETYNLDLDFSVLDPVASVLRTMELLAFGVALALATKKLLMGS